MSDVFVLASVQCENEPGFRDAEGRVVQSLLQSTRLAARRIQEAHWFSHGLQPLDLRSHGFSAQTPFFYWHSANLLDHALLHSMARSLQCEDRQVVMLGQNWPGQSSWPGQDNASLEGPGAAAALLLASSAAVERFKLLPVARLSLRMALSCPAQELPAAAVSRLIRAQTAQEAAARALSSGNVNSIDAGEAPEVEDLPFPEAVEWLVSDFAFESEDISAVLPQAQQLVALQPAPTGSLFMLDALLNVLTHHHKRWGILFSAGTDKNGLATLVQRI